MRNTITIIVGTIIVAMLAGCGKTESAEKPTEDKNWAPEMVDEHEGHDHDEHEGHDH